MARPVLAAAGCLAVLALSCPASAPLAAPAAPPPPRLCDFDASLCTGWTVGGTGMWRRGSSTPSTSTGPVRGEGGTQYFMFLETSQGNQGDESHLHSPFFTGVSNVSFFYHMYGSSMGSLSVETHSGGNWTSVWIKSGQQHTSQTASWKHATVDIAAGADQLRFKGVKGASFRGDMAVDTITIGGGVLAPPPPPSVACSFEFGICGWTLSGTNLGGTQIDSKWMRGSKTPSSGTGPAQAQSGASFMFLETSGGSFGDASYLISPPISHISKVTFYYHMHGRSMGTLSLETLVGNSWNSAWNKTGKQQPSSSSSWKQTSVDVPSTVVQVRFKGTKIQGYQGDMAVDAITVVAVSPPPPPPPPPPSPLYKPTNTECVSHADLLTFADLTQGADFATIRLRFSHTCRSCLEKAAPLQYLCFPPGQKGQCSSLDLQQLKAKPITATDDRPARVSVACLTCGYSIVGPSFEACKKLPGNCSSFPDDLACVRCKQAAFDQIATVCGSTGHSLGCHCKHGKPKTGKDCTVVGTAQCERCMPGYRLSTDETACNHMSTADRQAARQQAAAAYQAAIKAKKDQAKTVLSAETARRHPRTAFQREKTPKEKVKVGSKLTVNADIQLIPADSKARTLK
jgi:hypothetical protein